MPLYDIDFDDNDCICIDHRENICTVCAKPYKHRIRYLTFINGDRTIKDLEFITAHAECRSLVRQIEEQKQKLTDLEWKLYKLKTI